MSDFGVKMKGFWSKGLRALEKGEIFGPFGQFWGIHFGVKVWGKGWSQVTRLPQTFTPKWTLKFWESKIFRVILGPKFGREGWWGQILVHFGGPKWDNFVHFWAKFGFLSGFVTFGRSFFLVNLAILVTFGRSNRLPLGLLGAVFDRGRLCRGFSFFSSFSSLFLLFLSFPSLSLILNKKKKRKALN